MLKRNLMLLLTAVAFLLICGSQAFAAKTVINGIDANFPPFAYIDKTGQPAGFDVEAMNWIAKEMGFEVKHQPIAWDGIITSLMTRKIDIIASGMSVTPDRKKIVAFSDPYWTIDQIMVIRKDSDLTVEELFNTNKVVGVQQGTAEGKWLNNAVSKNGWNCKVRYYDSAPMSVEDLVNGRIDGAAMVNAPAKDACEKKPVKILGYYGMPSNDFSYAMRKGDTELIETINTGLARLMKTPYWKELIAKYDIK